jgi:uncharacterized metal-binding protein YceD (DUF177 family)
MQAHPAPDDSPWTVPLAVTDVADSGRRIAIAADATTRAAVADVADVREISRLEATFEIARHGRNGLRITGKVSASVGQDCVVTLEPMQSEIEEPIDVLFVAPEKIAAAEDQDPLEVDSGPDLEPLTGDSVDLGALATEFLLLGIDPYPRKPDAEFAGPQEQDDSPHPFATLAALKRDRGAG